MNRLLVAFHLRPQISLHAKMSTVMNDGIENICSGRWKSFSIEDIFYELLLFSIKTQYIILLATDTSFLVYAKEDFIDDLDDIFCSCRIQVCGLYAMQRIAKCDICIYFFFGLGIEMAKNIVLGGVK